ncbi:5-formyltetrahydrofolate cyclo-ligase [Oceaniovalibus guishaninsula JLT2003]|uniref:5-formyltetrahydrofolate cyclo-ligase n=1 Tax=Oceaniovalibus guishaninsula JLT2003 TaxID=1231392 RepID=K2HM27_9RHOB|nr:5-formyltetrahydrofolate cyclo-ligase [Oceaniovalibus guishaninsula]EKE43939.1 5-formyltetrahydrofolate cyclo-ligase [Oceaniovalibus guishaninsula JLT2003]
MTDAKATARRAAEARRAAVQPGPGDADLLAARLAVADASVVAGFLPIGSEIDPRPAMAALSVPVCVPVMVGRGLPLRFRRWIPGCTLERGPFGVAVPADGDWLVPDLLIVPLLAFDRRGQRLGYGGGYYDRTLAALRAAGPVRAWGFAFAAQEVAAVPVGPHDAPLDAIATEREWIVPGGRDRAEPPAPPG